MDTLIGAMAAFIGNGEVARNQVFPVPTTFSNEAELVLPTSNQFSAQSRKVIKSRKFNMFRRVTTIVLMLSLSVVQARTFGSEGGKRQTLVSHNSALFTSDAAVAKKQLYNLRALINSL